MAPAARAAPLSLCASSVSFSAILSRAAPISPTSRAPASLKRASTRATAFSLPPNISSTTERSIAGSSVVVHRPARHRLAQPLQGQRLGQIVVHAGVEAAIGLALQRIGRQRHDRRARPAEQRSPRRASGGSARSRPCRACGCRSAPARAPRARHSVSASMPLVAVSRARPRISNWPTSTSRLTSESSTASTRRPLGGKGSDSTVVVGDRAGRCRAAP